MNFKGERYQKIEYSAFHSSIEYLVNIYRG